MFYKSTCSILIIPNPSTCSALGCYQRSRRQQPATCRAVARGAETLAASAAGQVKKRRKTRGKTVGKWWKTVGKWWKTVGKWWKTVGKWWKTAGKWWKTVGKWWKTWEYGGKHGKIHGKRIETCWKHADLWLVNDLKARPGTIPWLWFHMEGSSAS